MVEALGINITPESIDEEVSLWRTTRLEKNKPVRPKVASAIKETTELILPMVYLKNGDLCIGNVVEMREYIGIVNDFSKRDRVTTINNAKAISFRLVKKALKKDNE